jgi:hypothetical protein
VSIDYSAPPHPCVHCGEPTDFGSGRFVNRIPADTYVETTTNGVEYRDGYACEECTEEIGYETPAGDVCRECGDIEGRERGPDFTPFWIDDARDKSTKRECVQCNNMIYDPGGVSDTP